MPSPRRGAGARRGRPDARAAHTELLIGPARFLDRPRMAIDPHDGRPAGRERPRRTGVPVPHPRSTIVFGRLDVRPGRGRLRDGDEVQRRVEQRERRTFAGTVERPAPAAGSGRRCRRPASALHVSRRQRAERARHFGHAQVGEMSLLERRQPVQRRRGRDVQPHSVYNFAQEACTHANVRFGSCNPVDGHAVPRLRRRIARRAAVGARRRRAAAR